MQDYAAKADNYFAYVRTDVEPLLPRHSRRVLEVGCGAGSTLRWLKEQGRCDRTVGIELFEAAAEIARAHVDQVLVGNAEALIETLAPGEGFDLVLCLDVLEHMIDPWAFVATLEGLVEPGGLVVASIPNVRHLRVTLPLLFAGRWRYRTDGILDRTHLRFFTRESAVELLTRPTLRVERVECGFVGPRSGSARLNAWTFGWAKDLLAVQYMLAARKAAPR